ncbi:MAG: SRPBCC domain-containing protein [Bacteroidia bacterium]|nr:SRPBCC domain-containing protein [Bacteroidia bacterium]
MKRFVQSEIRIKATATEILDAFLSLKHLKSWWGVDSALIQKKDGGLYTITWLRSKDGIKFISTGRIKLYNWRSHLHLEDMVYINSERSILGPCTLRFDVEEKPSYSVLKVVQSGFQKGKSWDWYYKAVSDGWPEALIMLKKYLEKHSS